MSKGSKPLEGAKPNKFKKLGDNVRRLRGDKDLTQEKFAELADINARTVYKIEKGEINLLMTTLVRIRNALGCTWDDLMKGL